MQHPYNGWERPRGRSACLFVFNVSTWKDFEDTLFVGGGGITKIVYIIRSFTKKKKRQTHSYKCICMCAYIIRHWLMYDYKIRHIRFNLWLRKIWEVIYSTNFCTIWLFCFTRNMCYFYTQQRIREKALENKK